MAIKVTGTTVINDSREIENVGDINRFIQKPQITNPVNSSTDNILGLTIQGTPYAPLYAADERLYREFEIDLDSGDFSNPERSTQINSDNFGPLDPPLDSNETYKVRIRDVSVNGTVSEYSDVVTFTTVNVTVETPTVTVEGELNSVPENPQISTSSFSVLNGSDTHESTDWEVIRTSDSVVVFSSFNDTSNRTSITITDDSLDPLEEYEFRARHRGVTYGTSDYGSKTATTVEFFAPTSIGESTFGGFYMGTICVASSCYYLIVAPNATGCACCQWKINDTNLIGLTNDFDGYDNTYNTLTSSTYPAGNFTATRTIGGFSDWYLPNYDDFNVIYSNGGGSVAPGDPLPAGERMPSGRAWTSREATTSQAYFVSDSDVDRANRISKDTFYPVRAVRREPI